jgi:hypothetical protein
MEAMVQLATVVRVGAIREVIPAEGNQLISPSVYATMGDKDRECVTSVIRKKG